MGLKSCSQIENIDNEMLKFPICSSMYPQSCPYLHNPMDCRPPSSSVHETAQARTLEWPAVSFSKESSLPRDQTQVSCIGRQVLYHWATREAHIDHHWHVQIFGIS